MLLLKVPVNPQYNKEHTQSKLGRGNDGGNITSSLETTTSPLNCLQNINKLSPLEHLPRLCMKGMFQESIMTNWWRKQSQIPFSMYARPSEKMASQILHSMTTPCLDLFYNDSIEPSEMQTQRKSIKRPSQCQSSQNLERKQSQNYQQQFSNLQDSEFSLPADLVNTSKYLQQNNDEQKSSAFKTFDFSKKDASLHMIMMN